MGKVFAMLNGSTDGAYTDRR